MTSRAPRLPLGLASVRDAALAIVDRGAVDAGRRQTMFIRVLDPAGRLIASCHVEPPGLLSQWLERYGPTATRCEVYTDEPRKGGTRVAVLRRYDEAAPTAA